MSTPLIAKETSMAIVFSVICGVFAGLIFGIRIGMDAQRDITERVETAMDQAQKRHREHLERADRRMDSIVECAKQAEHLDDTSDKLAFCERQAPKHP